MKNHRNNDYYTGLKEFLDNIPVIDSHEHLPIEEIKLSESVDAFTLYRQYARLSMLSAGMAQSDFIRLHDQTLSVRERFSIFNNYREIINWTSPVRVVKKTLKHFYDVEVLTFENFFLVTKKMKENYRPGIYDRILKKECNIEAVLQNAPDYEINKFSKKLQKRNDNISYNGMLKPVPSLWGYWDYFKEFVSKVSSEAKQNNILFSSLSDYLDAQKKYFEEWVAEGAVGFKACSFPYVDPDKKKANEIYSKLKNGKVIEGKNYNLLQSFLLNELLKIVSKFDVPVAFHTGVWGDFRETSCTNLIPFIEKNKYVKFDLFHMSIPYVREFGRIGANFPNAFLNMCWAPTVSPAMAVAALDEWLDQVPLNKITAFGGDVRWPVENIFGHLELAKEVTAKVCFRRIKRKEISVKQAENGLYRMFYINPKNLYKI